MILPKEVNDSIKSDNEAIKTPPSRMNNTTLWAVLSNAADHVQSIAQNNNPVMATRTERTINLLIILFFSPL